VFYHNYISYDVRVIGLSLMVFVWVLALVSIALIRWLKKDPIIQRAQPFFLQTLCLGAIITSTAIFTLSWDEDAGWTNHQLSVACTLTPWFFFLGHILIFCSLFVRLWRVDHAIHFKGSAVTISKAVLPLITFLAVTFSILLAHTVYDPWSWERHIIKESPAETYGKCQSNHDMAFFGPLMGLLFVAEAATLYFAWKTVNLPSDFRDSEAIMYTCFAQLQAWAVGVPMLGALGYSSANATYFARIFLAWIFSVSSVAVIIIPKISKAWINRRSPQGTSRKRRVSVSALYEPSSRFTDSKFDDLSSAFGGKSQVSKNPAMIQKITMADLHEIHEAAAEISSSYSDNLAEIKGSIQMQGVSAIPSLEESSDESSLQSYFLMSRDLTSLSHENLQQQH